MINETASSKDYLFDHEALRSEGHNASRPTRQDNIIGQAAVGPAAAQIPSGGEA